MNKTPRAGLAQRWFVRISAGRRHLAVLLGGAVALSTHLATAADPPRIVCLDGSCAQASGPALPALVIGEVVRVDDAAAADRLLAAAGRQGGWPAFTTAAPGEFGQLIRPVVIALQGPDVTPSLVIVLMTQFEFEGEHLPPGTLVRYAPHGIDHEQPPADIPALARYWPATGCVMTLCRAGDAACKELYRSGAFDRATGRGVDWRSNRFTSAQPLIDPQSRRALRPAVAASASASASAG